MMRALLFVVLGTVMLGPVDGWAAGLFGMMEIKANKIQSIPKWVDVLGRIRSEDLLENCNLGNNYCMGDRPGWFEMIQELRGEVPGKQMAMVNRWVNRYPYTTDDALWGKSDYWSTPGQFIDTSGDCEDYAITKYYSLKALGWDEDNLRLVILHDSVRDIAHAVLAAKVGGEEYILDNLTTEPLRHEYVRQYTPYYAVNAKSRWVFVKPMNN